MLIRAIAEEIAEHDGPGGDADAQLKEPGAAARGQTLRSRVVEVACEFNARR